jgi:hypothetical protein
MVSVDVSYLKLLAQELRGGIVFFFKYLRVLFLPRFTVCVSKSLLRFPALAVSFPTKFLLHFPASYVGSLSHFTPVICLVSPEPNSRSRFGWLPEHGPFLPRITVAPPSSTLSNRASLHRFTVGGEAFSVLVPCRGIVYKSTERMPNVSGM